MADLTPAERATLRRLVEGTAGGGPDNAYFIPPGVLLALLDMPDAAERREAVMRKALTEIAAFDDESGNRELAATGGYTHFDYPQAVRKAREALKENPDGR